MLCRAAAVALCALTAAGSIVPDGEPFSPMVYNETVWKAFSLKNCSNPPAEPTVDPYKGSNDTAPPAPYGADAVCGVKYVNDTQRTEYSLVSYVNVTAAQQDGAHVTHDKACGMCSSLADLSAYMSQTDLTTPIRACGLKHLLNHKKLLECIVESTSLSRPCAAIFFYNSENTKAQCLVPCLEASAEHLPNNLPPDNRLNKCLQCDEDKSGPVFKYYAGRTRRGSGLNSSIIRPVDQVFRVIHDYY
eukprot:TRINITY_DN28850_c0_g2_i1.p1 TRINITY_DN28850_c0_g2~~TRINITY_DN28850_c0_g2_i1.p1  ORF type:complete len:261 (+),score=104.00 TRINITY_DN28850_c0_g2_i1:48-785(+)